jgi:Cu-Zn family superoxide dismutase
MRKLIVGGITVCACIGAAQAQELKADMHRIGKDGVGESIGSVVIAPAPTGGARFVAELHGLPPGEHGFHVHQNGDCGPGPNAQGEPTAGMAAGGHWDPAGTKAHHGPEGQGHLGDLPALTVAADGTATGTVMAPRITDVAEIRGKALMIHAGGDNYSDQPQPLGGGGARIACGVIE